MAISSSPVQEATASGNSISSLVVTLGSTPTAGNCLVLALGERPPSTPNGISSISQTGVTWVKADADSDSRAEVWYVLNVPASGVGTAVTITFTTSMSFAGADVSEWSGIATASAVDNTNNTQGDNVALSISLVTSNADDLVIGSSGGKQTTMPTGFPTGGFTLLAWMGSGHGGDAGGAGLAYRVVSSTGTWTLGSTGVSSSFWSMAIVALKAAVAATSLSMNLFDRHTPRRRMIQRL